MWAFVFVLAIVPMAYYWSDSVVSVVPALAPYFPDKKSNATASTAEAGGTERPGEDALPGTVQKGWAQRNNEAGYVAWLISTNGEYRLTVGCKAGRPPSMQVRHASGAAMPERLKLDFNYGSVTLRNGDYAGKDVLWATAQFKTVKLEPLQASSDWSKPSFKPDLAQFYAESRASEQVARALQANCYR